MAFTADKLPYMQTSFKKVALPRDAEGERIGNGCIAFLLSNNWKKSVGMIENKLNMVPDSRYTYFYYNLLYRGSVGPKRYNIRALNDRKEVYDAVKRSKSVIIPHPPATLDAGPNRNTYFDMSKYLEIFYYMTKSYSPARTVNYFWSYFKSIWFSKQTLHFPVKFVLVNLENFPNFGTSLRENITNPVFVIYYTLYKRFELVRDLDLDFYFYAGNAVLRVNPSKCDEKSYIDFKRELKRVFRKVSIMDDDAIDTEDQKEEIKANLKNSYNFVGNPSDDVEVTELKPEKEPTTEEEKKTKENLKKIEDSIDQKIDAAIAKADKVLPKATEDKGAFIQTQAEMDVEADNDLAEQMFNMMKAERVKKTPVSSARDKKLRERQQSLTMGNVTFSSIANDDSAGKRPIPVKDVSNAMHTINENAKKIKFVNINKDYIENVMPKDIAKVFTALNTKDMKLYVRDYKIEDTSDELNLKDTHHVTLEDEKGQRFTVTVDIPKFLDNKFLYLGGNKKIIGRQNFYYPVVKTKPNEVQIVTNYNKMFMERVGTRSINSVQRILKLIESDEKCMKYFKTGNNASINKGFLTTIEYDEFGKVLTSFKTNDCELFFSQADAQNYVNTHDVDMEENQIFVGIENKKPIFLDMDTQLSVDGRSLSDIIVANLPDEEVRKQFFATKVNKKLMYTQVTLMSKNIPLIVLLMFWEGITSVLKKMDLKFYFSKTSPKELKQNESVIRFQDAYLVYEANLAADLLMNGIKVLDTEKHDIEEYNTSEAYMQYFNKVYGKTNILSAIYNFYEFMIDPITLEVLEDINLPKSIVELCIYANSLLADESFTPMYSQKLCRVRSTEIIPAILYDNLATAYLAYKNSMGKKKVSVRRDCVIRDLLGLQTVEDYSTLNPVVEMEKDRSLSMKGFRGVNMDKIYSEVNRSYDKSFVGTVAMNTSADGNCGVSRYLTMEPNITSARGYVNVDEDLKNLKDVNLFSPAEIMYPLGNTRDDSIRTALACKQSKHVIPVKNSAPALITNGMDELARFNLSSDFVMNAEEDGTIIDKDEKSGVMIVEYTRSKKRVAINLAPQIAKNGGGGFFLANELVSDKKVGDKVKKDEPIAWHKDFFSKNKFTGLRMNVGSLEKVAIMSAYSTYNDSCMITEKMADDCETNMTFCKSVVIGKNSNIFDIRSIGDHVEIGDPLVVFDTSYEDTELNKLLGKLSEDEKDTLLEGSNNTVRSKYAGKIVDIKVYAAIDLEEMSPSLQKVVSNFYKKVNDKKKFVTKYANADDPKMVKCGMYLNESTSKVSPNIYGVIKGQKVEDSVLIEFYVEHGDRLGVGDKLAFLTVRNVTHLIDGKALYIVSDLVERLDA